MLQPNWENDTLIENRKKIIQNNTEITSFNAHNNPMRKDNYCGHFTDKEIKAREVK